MGAEDPVQRWLRKENGMHTFGIRTGAHIHVKYMTYHDDMLYAYVNSCHVQYLMICKHQVK